MLPESCTIFTNGTEEGRTFHFVGLSYDGSESSTLADRLTTEDGQSHIDDKPPLEARFYLMKN